MLHITLIQATLFWENPTANRAMLEERIFTLPEPTDLIILPEMFTTGFTMKASSLAEPMKLTTFRWMKQMAAQTGAAVMGSYIVQDGSSFYNRLVWMEPDGTADTYDKRHLFRPAGENQTYTAGNRRLIRRWKGWNICPLICYDLRFPVWSRNRATEYDLLVYVANWPVARRTAWNTLLQARAIENLCYTVGVNRVGEDGKGLSYAGESAVIDPTGIVLFRQADTEVVHQMTLSLDELRSYRDNFPALRDADSFLLES